MNVDRAAMATGASRRAVDANAAVPVRRMRAHAHVVGTSQTMLSQTVLSEEEEDALQHAEIALSEKVFEMVSMRCVRFHPRLVTAWYVWMRGCVKAWSWAHVPIHPYVHAAP